MELVALFLIVFPALLASQRRGCVMTGTTTLTPRLSSEQLSCGRQAAVIRGRDIPRVKMLRRVTQVTEDRQSVSVTLVYQASEAPLVRWLRHDPAFGTDGAEMANTMPVINNPTYQSSFSYITSGDVTACTLVISGLNASANQGNVQLETIFTLGVSVQYQLTTVVRLTRARLTNQERIDNAEWTAVPAPLVRHGAHLDLTCKAFVPNHRTSELIMYRAEASRDVTAPVQLTYGILQRVDSDSNFTSPEQSGVVRQFAVRTIVNGKHAIFDVSLQMTAATAAVDGVFQCAVERQASRSYTISVVSACPSGPSLSPPPPPLPERPRVAMTPCRKADYDPALSLLKMAERKAACLRCRAIGYPPPSVALFRQPRRSKVESKEEVTAKDDVVVHKYVNVAEGGLSEAVYAFFNVQRSLKDYYCCQATTQDGDWFSQHCFQITTIPPR